MVSFGERLRAERVRLALSQEQTAAIGGVTRKTQGLYEKNERMPDAQYLTELAGAGMDICYVLTGDRAKDVLAAAAGPEPVITETPQAAAIDLPRLQKIARLLEEVAAAAGRQWIAADLVTTAAEVYNYLAAEGRTEDEHIARVVHLVASR